MILLSNGTRFHSEHYRKVVSVRNALQQRESRYCFALGREMGENGRVSESPLYGKLFRRGEKIYSVASVNIHFWEGGYYWFLVFEDERGSSAPRIYENINSESALILESAAETQREFQSL